MKSSTRSWNKARRRASLQSARSFRYPPVAIQAGIVAAAERLAKAVYGSATEDGLGAENIIGIGVGRKRIGKQTLPTLAIKVLVVKKSVPSRIAPSCLIAPAFGGYLTDVVEVGEAVMTVGRGNRMYTEPVRPAPGGVCIGPEKEDRAGTLSCIVSRGDRPHLLTVEHILAPLNEHVAQSKKIVQPGEQRRMANRGGVLATLAESSRAEYYGTKENALKNAPSSDWAVAEVHIDDVDPNIMGIGKIGGMKPVTHHTKGRLVRKSGRGSGTTQGTFGAHSMVGAIGYRDGYWIHLNNFVFIERRGWHSRFVTDGDSGALVVTADTNVPIGIVVARTRRGDAYVIPLESILTDAKASLVRARSDCHPPYLGGR